MKKGIVIFIWFLSTLPVLGQAQNFYDINTVNTVELIFQQSNWDQILDDLYAVGEEERLVGTAIINGLQFDSVGVRYKGNSSYRRHQKKNPLNIKLDHIIDNQELDGYGTVKLANAFKDPSFIREVISYEIARKYMPASEANFVNVYINGELIGLYTSVQSVDKFFTSIHFGSRDNPFFKGELTHGSPRGPVIVWGYHGPDSTRYTDYYELRSDFGWQDLVSFLDVLNNTPENVEEVLNVDRHLWMLAFDNLMVNLDAPINFAHNFYLYKDGSGRFNPIMWDLNENFGVFVGIIGGNTFLNIKGLQQFNPFFNMENPNYPIIQKILSNPKYGKMYIAHMKTIIEENFANGWFVDRAVEIQDMIDGDYQTDPNAFYSYSDFKNNIYSTVGGFGQPSIIGLMELMDARVDFLSTHNAFKENAPSITNISYPTHVSQNSIVWFSVEVQDADLVKLRYRHGGTGGFDRTVMHDDGNHQDGSAGDGLFGVSLDVRNSDIDFYIYAENEGAASLLPQRAEYEFHAIDVISSIVINEFMASNDFTPTDPHGEYDDWIELYNQSPEQVSVSGYYLSDDTGALTQWAFPDTTIEGHGYLIIWADRDEGQEGLHTNFKLSASGEMILLVNSDLEIVDQVIFGQQVADLSHGRYPNGTGEFIEMAPSFSTENKNGITDVRESTIGGPARFLLEQNHPNPFNPTTRIRYDIPHRGRVKLTIYDVSGRELEILVDGENEAGYYEIEWHGLDMPSGVYFYRITVKSRDSKVLFHDVKKMILVK